VAKRWGFYSSVVINPLTSLACHGVRMFVRFWPS